MKQLTRKRVVQFLVVFASIAIFLNVMIQHRREQFVATRAKMLAEEKAVRDAASEHTAFLAKYLNQGPSSHASGKAIAIVAVSEQKEFNRVLTDAIARSLKGEGIRIFTSLFTPTFIADGLFDDAFADPNHVLKQLDLTGSLSVLVLARQRVQYSANPSLENVITATMEVEIGAFRPNARNDNHTWTLKATGAGFKEIDARAMAEERLIKQLGSDIQLSSAKLSTENP